MDTNGVSINGVGTNGVAWRESYKLMHVDYQGVLPTPLWPHLFDLCLRFYAEIGYGRKSSWTRQYAYE